MKTISIETNNRIHRITIGPYGLQSRCLSKSPDEPELKRQYEEEQTAARADIEQELREEHGSSLSEEEIQAYIADQMQPMNPIEEDLYYERTTTNFVDVSLYDAMNIDIQKNNNQIRIMLLGGPYGPLCILDDMVEDRTDQHVLRAGIAEILNTIAAALPYDTSLTSRMKIIRDKMEHDLGLLEETSS